MCAFGKNLGDGLSEINKSNGSRFSIIMAIAHFMRFLIFAKIINVGHFSKSEKKQLKYIFFKILDMRYSYSCQEYAVKIL